MFAIFKSPAAPKPDVASAQTPSEPEHRPSSASAPTIQAPLDAPQTPVQPHAVPLPESPNPVASLAPPSTTAQGAEPAQSSAQSDQHGLRSQSQSALPQSPTGAAPPGKVRRRFSFPSFSFLRSDPKQNKASVSLPLQAQDAAVSKAPNSKSMTGRALSALIVGSGSATEKRAKESAVVVRSIIIANHNIPSGTAKIPSKSDVARVKAQLLEPKTAAKVIAHLRTLPPHPEDTAANAHPIHAVCLDVLDKDFHDHFAPLQSIATASVSTASAALADLHLVDLVTAPNMGFGAPVTAQGLFAGAVPTAETVIEGIEQITPQLMALGFATGKAILPDHKGVIVPVDRISALTYWWGFEICLPPPTIAHLEVVEDPGSALLNLLSALALLNQGVREILPFIRYIAQFVQSEWGLIKRADEGKGVVCTATWLLPVALVPRPWDFPDPPPHAEPTGQSRPTSPSVQRFSATLATPKPSSEVPNNNLPRASSAFSAETKGEDESRPAISNQPPILPELVVSSPGSIDGAHHGGADEQAHRRALHDGEPTAH